MKYFRQNHYKSRNLDSLSIDNTRLKKKKKKHTSYMNKNIYYICTYIIILLPISIHTPEVTAHGGPRVTRNKKHDQKEDQVRR